MTYNYSFISKNLTISGCERENDPVVLLYSQEQNCFHIETLSRLLSINNEAMIKHMAGETVSQPSYHVVGMFANDEEAKACMNNVPHYAKKVQRQLEAEKNIDYI